MIETATPSGVERILITGASGNVGLETLRELMKHPAKLRFQTVAGLRSPDEAKLSMTVQPDAFVRLDFADASTFDEALDGISRVLLVRPPELADVDAYFKPFVAAMKRTRVRQVVFLSSQGVENYPITPHYKIEKLIVEAGLPFTFLRPSFFMQNLCTTHRAEIRLRSEIFIPAGNGRTSLIDVRDIGAVASLVLTSPANDYLNRGYELTGSEALTYPEMSRILSNVLGRTITYRDPSVLRFIWQKWHKERTSLDFTLIMVVLYTVSKWGKAANLTGDTQQLLHRPPISFRQFVEDYKATWIP